MHRTIPGDVRSHLGERPVTRLAGWTCRTPCANAAAVRGRAHGPCLRSARLALTAFLATVVPAIAQHEHHQPPPDQGWGWAVESSVFLTGNIQERKFRDFHQVESQNWMMGVAARAGSAQGD